MEGKLKLVYDALLDKTREVSGLGFWYVDLDKKTSYWDDYTKAIHEVPHDFESNIENGIEFYKEGDSRDKISKIVGDLIETGAPFDTELQIVTFRKREVWVRAIGQPHYENDKLIGLYGTFQDIDAQKKKLEEVNLLKERLILATTAAEIGVWDWDIQNDVLVWDDMMYRFYGVNKSDFAEAYEAWQKGLHPDDAEKGNHNIELALNGEKDFDTSFRVIHPDGSIKFIGAKAKVLRDSKGKPLRMIGTNWDLTDELKSKKKIQDFANKMAMAQNIAKFGVWEWDLENNGLSWDKYQFELYGASEQDVINNDPMEFWSRRVHPDDEKIMNKATNDALAGVCKLDTLFRILLPSGEIKHIRAVGHVERNEKGEPQNFMGINWDVSNELKKTQDLEFQNKRLTDLSEKLKKSNESLEEFAYIASHDLKTPIRNMATFAQFLHEDYSDVLDEQGLEMLSGIKMQAKRMTNLVDDLLTYSRVNKMKLEKKQVNLNSLVKSAIELLGFSKAGAVEVEVKDLGTLKVDPVRMREVFNNLITNAVKYNNSDVKQVVIWREGDIIYVKDNGIGINEKYKNKVFAFFKRLHAKDEYGGGTGAGMAIVKKVLDQHNATIDFKSKEGEGTTFILDFN